MVKITGSCNASMDQSMDSVVDLSLSSEDSDLSVPHVQPLLPLACKTILHVNAAEQQALTIFFIFIC